MEEIKTKTESQEIPDKVTHVTMGKIKNDAVGNCDIDPTCNNLRLETEKTENIGPLETEAAFLKSSKPLPSLKQTDVLPGGCY